MPKQLNNSFCFRWHRPCSVACLRSASTEGHAQRLCAICREEPVFNGRTFAMKEFTWGKPFKVETITESRDEVVQVLAIPVDQGDRVRKGIDGNKGWAFFEAATKFIGRTGGTVEVYTTARIKNAALIKILNREVICNPYVATCNLLIDLTCGPAINATEVQHQAELAEHAASIRERSVTQLDNCATFKGADSTV